MFKTQRPLKFFTSKGQKFHTVCPPPPQIQTCFMANLKTQPMTLFQSLDTQDL